MAEFVPGVVSPDDGLDWLLPMPDGKPLSGADESGPASDVRVEPLPARSAGVTVPVVDNGETGAGVQTLSGACWAMAALDVNSSKAARRRMM